MEDSTAAQPQVPAGPGRAPGFLSPVHYAERIRYRRPPRGYLRLQRLGPLLTRLALSPRYVVTLEVPGRRSGEVRRTTLARASWHGRQYLVALAGESEWVRNVRAAEGRVVLARGRRRVGATLTEVPVAARPSIIRAYMLRPGRHPGSRAVATEARYVFGVGPAALEAEIATVAEHYPVFAVKYADGGGLAVDRTITGEELIRVPVQEVFAFVADQRNEPRYNPRMLRAEKVTPGPIGPGTRFHQLMRMPGPEARMASELTAFDAPRSLSLRSHLTWMDTAGTLTFTPVNGGTRLTWHWRLHFRGAARLLTPLLLAIGERQERATWDGLRRHLEAGSSR